MTAYDFTRVPMASFDASRRAFEYWISLTPAAPLFGVRWAFQFATDYSEDEGELKDVTPKDAMSKDVTPKDVTSKANVKPEKAVAKKPVAKKTAAKTKPAAKKAPAPVETAEMATEVAPSVEPEAVEREDGAQPQRRVGGAHEQELLAA